MKHLTDEQLGAHLDGTPPESAREAREAHLAGCDACRERLAALASLDRELAGALEHDPGEAYFASFADRVAARIAAQPQAGRVAADAPRSGWAGLFSPRGLALAGGTAALLVAAGLAWVTFRGQDAAQLEVVRERANETTPLAKQAEPPVEPQAVAPPAATSTAPTDLLMDAAPGKEAASKKDVALDRRQAAVAPGHVVEMRRDAHGEDVPVGPARQMPKRVQAPVTTPPGPPVSDMALRKRERGAQPMGTSGSKQAAAGAAAPVPAVEELQATRSDETRTQALLDKPAEKESVPAPSSSAFAKDMRATPAPAPATADAKAKLDIVQPQSKGSTWGQTKTLYRDGARVCGSVTDAQGRPVPRAQLIIPRTGKATLTDANGAFCLDAAPGAEITVMAMGFRTARTTLGKRVTNQPLAFELQAVSALGDRELGLTGSRGGAPSRPPMSAELRMEADDPYAGESAMARTAAHEARAKVALAEREQRPDLLDEAAALWADVGANSLREVAIRDARFQSARTRHAAWRLQPSAARRTAGRDAAQLYLQVAPARGEERESALRWLREFAAAIR